LCAFDVLQDVGVRHYFGIAVLISDGVVVTCWMIFCDLSIETPPGVFLMFIYRHAEASPREMQEMRKRNAVWSPRLFHMCDMTHIYV